MIDARRMEVYTSFDGETKAVVVEHEDSLYDGDKDVYYFGDGAAKCAKVFTRPNWHYIPDIVPEAQYVGALAERGKKKVESTDLAYYEPFYLKEFIAAQSHVKGLK
jgi:tRNA threonylcarbamoyladenosine biosynthesis protein TsaB